jgi:phage terminase small subunit
VSYVGKESFVTDRKRTHKVKVSTSDPSAIPLLDYGITDMQEKFCQIYATQNVTQTEAAKIAGYSDPAPMASKFLNGRDYPKVVDRIREIKAELAKKYEVTYDNHITELAKIRDIALQNGQTAAAVAAEKQRGMAAGLYISRSEILVGRIDQMSKDEVLREIAKLTEEFPALASLGKIKEINPVHDREEDVELTALKPFGGTLDED